MTQGKPAQSPVKGATWSDRPPIRTRVLVLAMLALFMLTFLLSSAAIFYVLVLENQTRSAICDILRPGLADPKLTAQQAKELLAALHSFSCSVPSTFRSPSAGG